jgi:hypothetical protein
VSCPKGRNKFRVFVRWVLRRTFEHKIDGAGHVVRMGEKRDAYRILVGSQKERDH